MVKDLIWYDFVTLYLVKEDLMIKTTNNVLLTTAQANNDMNLLLYLIQKSIIEMERSFNPLIRLNGGRDLTDNETDLTLTEQAWIDTRLDKHTQVVQDSMCMELALHVDYGVRALDSRD